MLEKRQKQFLLLGVFLLLSLFVSSSKAEVSVQQGKMIRHDLKVVLYPEEHRLSVEDSVALPENPLPDLRFLLHRGLNPSSPTQGVTIVRDNRTAGEILFESFKVKLPPEIKSFIIIYGGNIYHPIEQFGKEQARGFSHTPGIISEEGVYLSGSSYWYPRFDDEEFLTFILQVDLPKKWEAVSQGERKLHVQKEETTSVHWESPELQEEIYLVAGKFIEYIQPDRVTAMVFLREPDKELANKYLEATAKYIALYETLIGPYPYKKFALVENFWETGLGMPSFTLLGQKIIRFPFIINTSYPHEILHNWWGNSVFPDYRSGNWSEGLTAYLSDHLLKEQQGNGAEYRQVTLQKYADYVLSERDFPLTEFHSRYSSPSEAVGYGKSLMFFHMLRQELGDKTFTEGLQEFYREKKFQLSSFSDLKENFEKISGKKLDIQFNQWIKRTGAPKIKLSTAKVKSERDAYILNALIEQIQSGVKYNVRIPIAVTMEGQEKAYQTSVVMDKKRYELKLPLSSRPLRIDIDPEFDLFRRLDRDEIPPALSQAFGAKKMLILLPYLSDKTLLQAYKEFAKVLSNSGPDTVEVKLDNEIKRLPSDCTVTILGWENRFLKEILPALSRYKVSIDQNFIQIGKTRTQRGKHSVVFTSWNPENKDMALTLIASDLVEALPGLGRKLPHYHKYSYLVFKGDEPENVLKGRWPILDSPMTAFLPDKDGVISKIEMGGLAPREPLITLPQVFSKERMMETIRFLSSEELKGRGLGTEELDRAAEYIEERFKEAGLIPAGDKERSYFQILKDPEQNTTIKNVIGVIPSKKSEMSDQSVVIGAHYDHLGLGWPDVRDENKRKIHPGADDNASGVAVLIELARILGKSLDPDRSVIFAAFTGEEVGKRGSQYYIANYKPYPVEKCIGMLNLDTVGRLGKKKLFVLGTGSAKEWPHIFRGVEFVTGVEIETVSEKLDSSDNISFEDAGVPAVQLFTGPHLDYHRPTDTADKIDPQGLLKVATAAKEVIEYLASRKEPLTVTVTPGEKDDLITVKERKVSLGIIPDFSYSNGGCRLSGVVPDSPAESCGLKEGDVIVKINSHAVKSLKDLSNILKSLTPGTKISITFIRDEREMIVDAKVIEK